MKSHREMKPSSNTMDAVGMDYVRQIDGTAPGSRSFSAVYASLERLAETHPVWFSRFEDSDLMVMPSAQLIELLDGAPSHEARGYIAGVISTRMHMCSVGGRPFFEQPSEARL
jgi:hypothetical protein